MLAKIKYVGVSTEDFVELYTLHITDCCYTAFHSSLSQRLSNKLEGIQKACLRSILDVMYVDFDSALEMCGLKSLHARREHRSLLLQLNVPTIKITSQFFLSTHPRTHIQSGREEKSWSMCQ